MCPGCRSDQSGLHAIIPESVPRCPNVSRMSQRSNRTPCYKPRKCRKGPQCGLGVPVIKRTPCYNTRKCPKVSQCVPDVAVIKADSMLYYPKVSQGVPMWLGCRGVHCGVHAIIH